MKSISTQVQKLWIIDVIALALCVIVTTIVGVGVIKPMLSKHSTLIKQRQQLVSEEQKCSRLSAAVLSMRKRSNALQLELETGAIHLDPADQMNQRIAQLTRLLGDCNLELEDIQTQSPIPHRRCDLVPIHIVGLGGYIESTRFLEKLHQSLPDIAVASFRLNGTPGIGTVPGQFSFNLCWFAAPSKGSDA